MDKAQIRGRGWIAATGRRCATSASASASASAATTTTTTTTTATATATAAATAATGRKRPRRAPMQRRHSQQEGSSRVYHTGRTLPKPT